MDKRRIACVIRMDVLDVNVVDVLLTKWDVEIVAENGRVVINLYNR